MAENIRALPSIFFLFLLFTMLTTGCGTPGKVAFELKGVSSEPDGAFTNGNGFRVVPSRIQLVVGDWHLKLLNPDKELTEFANLAPLLKPGEQIASDEIGKEGKFPGLWVVNLMPKAAPTLFPVGNVDMQLYQEIRWRLAPAVSGVRGLSTQDPVYQNTLAFVGSAQKGTTSCNFQLTTAFEKGLGNRISLKVTNASLTRYTIGVDYAVWFEDIDFSSVCKGSTNPVLLSNQSHPAIVDAIKKNITRSFRFQFSSTP
jgi:hypothetical protein